MKTNNTREKLKEARNQKGYTQADLAKLLEMSQRNYQYLEAGYSFGKLNKWKQIGQILGVPWQELIETEPPTNERSEPL